MSSLTFHTNSKTSSSISANGGKQWVDIARPAIPSGETIFFASILSAGGSVDTSGILVGSAGNVGSPTNVSVNVINYASVSQTATIIAAWIGYKKS